MQNGTQLLNAAQVRAAFGGVSDMALWRWSQNPDLGFPKPIRINRRRFWRADEIDAFIERQGDR